MFQEEWLKLGHIDQACFKRSGRNSVILVRRVSRGVVETRSYWSGVFQEEWSKLGHIGQACFKRSGRNSVILIRRVSRGVVETRSY